MPPRPSMHQPHWAQRLASQGLSAFHAYGTWLVAISWKRFVLLSILLVVATAMLQELPPFSWSYTERVVEAPRERIRAVTPPAAPKPPAPAQPARPAPGTERSTEPGAATGAWTFPSTARAFASVPARRPPPPPRRPRRALLAPGRPRA